MGANARARRPARRAPPGRVTKWSDKGAGKGGGKPSGGFQPSAQPATGQQGKQRCPQTPPPPAKGGKGFGRR
eukprot:6493437-Pyramimonas_sp.AAC.1